MDDPTTLPVTTHFLKADQRVRLMRSTRKMEHLLGETPLFIDTNSPVTPTFPQSRQTRAAYIYVAPARSSSLGVHIPPNGDSSQASTSRVPARPLLAVRVPAPTNRDSGSFALASPASVLSFPTPPKSSADEQRRHRTRKMARIFRTLGEPVPAELVFPAGAPPAPPAPPRPRRTSTLAKRRSSRLVRVSSSSSLASRARRNSLLTRGGDGDVEEEESGGAALDPIESDGESASVYSTLSGGDWERVPQLQPLAMPSPSPPRAGAPSESTSPSHPRAPGRASTAFASTTRTSVTPKHPLGYGYDRPRGTHRKEKGWSGEWVAAGSGVQNMDEVANRLRGLKMK